MSVRQKDIAKDLNLSIVTVSKVIRGHPDISSKTRKRVLARMKELNYQPNWAARSLLAGRTWTLGLVVPDLLHPFFAQIAKTLSAVVRKHGYNLVISSSEENPLLEQQEIERLLGRRVDVMLVASGQRGLDSFRRVEDVKIPLILLDRQVRGIEANFVGVDDVLVGRLATSHLVEQGCKRIAHIRGPEVSTALGRLQGYKEALTSSGIVPPAGLVISIGSSGDHRGERGGYEAAKKLLSAASQPDGIFCFNDPVALGAMRAIFDAGLKIPEDIAVVGCGNLSYSDFLRVPLSSVDQRTETIGKRAATLAIQLAEGKAVGKPKTILVEPTLVVRGSSLR
jgi:LacI family transcriptional regulator